MARFFIAALLLIATQTVASCAQVGPDPAPSPPVSEADAALLELNASFEGCPMVNLPSQFTVQFERAGYFSTNFNYVFKGGDGKEILRIVYEAGLIESTFEVKNEKGQVSTQYSWSFWKRDIEIKNCKGALVATVHRGDTNAFTIKAASGKAVYMAWSEGANFALTRAVQNPQKDVPPAGAKGVVLGLHPSFQEPWSVSASTELTDADKRLLPTLVMQGINNAHAKDSWCSEHYLDCGSFWEIAFLLDD